MTRAKAEKIRRGIEDKIENNTVDMEYWADFWGFTVDEYDEFLDMAIEALAKEPKEAAKKKNEPQMNQYIRREEILNHEVCKGVECKDCPFAEGPLCRLRRYVLHVAPSADVAEVRHGEWIVYPLMDEGRVELECPICGDTFIRAVDYKPHFCENCGAKMKGQRNDSN